MSQQKSRKFVTTALALLVIVACSPEPSINNESLVAGSIDYNITLADYQRAEQFLSVNTADLVQNNILAQYWQENDRLIYRRSTEEGSEYVIVDVDAEELGKNILFDSLTSCRGIG